MQKRASGGSRNSMNYNNSSRDNAPTRGALVDPQTYGMLLWQSKLQTKLLQEQKEKRQTELESQQRRAREKKQQSPEETEKSQVTERKQHTPPFVEIPQMILGPAPYTITSPTPIASQSPNEGQHQNPTESSNNAENFPNGQATSSSGANQPPLFPNLSSRMRSSVSCDNFGKLPPPPSILGSIVSIQQMGGAGSVRRSPSGKILTGIRGDPEIRYHQKDTRGFDQSMRYLMDRDKVLEYKRDLDRQLEENKKWRNRLGSGAIKEITRKGFIENGDNSDGSKLNPLPPGGHHHNHRYQFNHSEGISGNNKNGSELAPLMRKFNSLPKLNGLSSTDVTRPYVHSPRNEFFHPVQPNEVAETLSSQLREKAWLSRKQQENERVATEKHFQTWDSLWGRPGAGAPISFAEKNLAHAVSFGNLYGFSHRDVGGVEQQHRNQNSSGMGYNKVNLFKALHMTHQLPGRPK